MTSRELYTLHPLAVHYQLTNDLIRKSLKCNLQATLVFGCTTAKCGICYQNVCLCHTRWVKQFKISTYLSQHTTERCF